MQLEYFRMIDRVTDYDSAARTIKCASQVPTESPVFEGHFPNYPLVPGVLLIETMAQAAGHLTLAQVRYEQMAFLVGVKDAKFRSFVLPGRPLEIEAALGHEGSGFTATKARVISAGERICECEVLLRLMPFPAAHFRDSMCAEAKRIGMPAEVYTG